MQTWRSPDGIEWAVAVALPGSSNAMVVFRHPSGKSARLDRYNWYISNGPEARSVTSRLSAEKILASLNDDALAQKVDEASCASDEKLWRLPLYVEYHDKIKTDYAEAYYGRAAAFRAQGQKNSAVADFRVVLTLRVDAGLKAKAETQLKELGAL